MTGLVRVRRRGRLVRLLVGLATAVVAPLALVALSGAPAGAAEFPVTTTTDGGSGSLREAVQTLAVNAGGDTVVLQSGATYTLTCAQGGQLTHGNTPLTIQGNGATITMEAGCNQRILSNGTGALVFDNVTISGVNITVTTISGALVTAGGSVDFTNSALASNTITATAGDIFGLVNASGAVTFTGSTLSGNTLTATGSLGGALVNGSVTMTGSSLTNTTGTGSDIDGLFNGACQLTGTTINGSTIHATTGGVFGGLCDGAGTLAGSSIMNTSVVADGGGQSVFGGLFDATCALTDSGIDTTTVTANDNVFGGVCDGAGTLTRSTISRTATTAGSNIFGSVIDGDATLTNSTLSHNTYTAPTVFGGVIDGATTLVYATVDANTAPVFKQQALTTFGSVIAESQGGAACSGVTTTSNGFNFSDDTSCNLTGTTDRQGAGDPLLGPLAANGGQGLTQVPQTNSPLVDAIPTASCQADGASGITTDERSLPRPEVTGGFCDIGAVEVQPAPAPAGPAAPVAAVVRFTG